MKEKTEREKPGLKNYPNHMSLEGLLRDEGLLEDVTEIIEIESYF